MSESLSRFASVSEIFQCSVDCPFVRLNLWNLWTSLESKSLKTELKMCIRYCYVADQSSLWAGWLSSLRSSGINHKIAENLSKDHFVAQWQDVLRSKLFRGSISKGRSMLLLEFWLDNACQGIRIVFSKRCQDDHLVRRAIGNRELVAKPSVETLLRIRQLFSPIGPVPRDLTQTPIDAEPKRDWKNPKWIEKKYTWRHEYRVTARPLLIVVDEHIVPGESADVEGVECAEEPEERNAD